MHITIDELTDAITRGASPRAVLQFVAFGGDVNARLADSGLTLLHLAVEYEHLPMIHALIDAGADIESRAASGWTPLHQAVDFDIDTASQTTGWAAGDFIRTLTFATTKLLIALGADAEARCVDGRTPRDMAAAYSEEVAKKYDEAVAHARKP